jgi:hypothetical protein
MEFKYRNIFYLSTLFFIIWLSLCLNAQEVFVKNNQLKFGINYQNTTYLRIPKLTKSNPYPEDYFRNLLYVGGTSNLNQFGININKGHFNFTLSSSFLNSKFYENENNIELGDRDKRFLKISGLAVGITYLFNIENQRWFRFVSHLQYCQTNIYEGSTIKVDMSPNMQSNKVITTKTTSSNFHYYCLSGGLGLQISKANNFGINILPGIGVMQINWKNLKTNYNSSNFNKLFRIGNVFYISVGAFYCLPL